LRCFEIAGLAHVEGLGQFRDRGFTTGQARQDGAPRRVGEREKGEVEAVGAGDIHIHTVQ
jgi:hypothetical protein